MGVSVRLCVCVCIKSVCVYVRVNFMIKCYLRLIEGVCQRLNNFFGSIYEAKISRCPGYTDTSALA